MPRFDRCPRKHKLPHDTDWGQCTPVLCAEVAAEAEETPAPKKRRTSLRTPPTAAPMSAAAAALDTATEDKLAPLLRSDEEGRAEAAQAKSTALRRIDQAVAHHVARMAHLNVPAGLEGKAAEDYADKKALQLLPLAMAELEFNLKYGDAQARQQAARDVREMTGRGKRELHAAQGPAIVIQMAPGQSLNMPQWAQRVEPKPLPAADVEAPVEEKP